MLKFDAMTEAQQGRLAEVAASHGMTLERLLEIAQRRQNFERDTGVTVARPRVVEPNRKSGRFHFGESTGGYKRT